MALIAPGVADAEKPEAIAAKAKAKDVVPAVTVAPAPAPVSAPAAAPVADATAKPEVVVKPKKAAEPKAAAQPKAAPATANANAKVSAPATHGRRNQHVTNPPRRSRPIQHVLDSPARAGRQARPGRRGAQPAASRRTAARRNGSVRASTAAAERRRSRAANRPPALGRRVKRREIPSPDPSAVSRTAARTVRGNAAAKPPVHVPAKDDHLTVQVATAATRVIAVVPRWLWLTLGLLLLATLAQALRNRRLRRRGADEREHARRTTVTALASAVAAKDGCTGRHIERVSELGLLLAKEVVPHEIDDPQMAFGFLLHDVGKLNVPDAILNKPGKLNLAEMAVMRSHAESGARMLEELGFLDKAIDVVRHHHERWDGGGYPSGLVATQIPLWARIFSIVDSVDAMTSERPYACARTLDEALAILEEESGRQFDPRCVEAFKRLDRHAVQALLETPATGVSAPTSSSRRLPGRRPASRSSRSAPAPAAPVA